MFQHDRLEAAERHKASPSAEDPTIKQTKINTVDGVVSPEQDVPNLLLQWGLGQSPCAGFTPHLNNVVSFMPRSPLPNSVPDSHGSAGEKKLSRLHEITDNLISLWKSQQGINQAHNNRRDSRDAIVATPSTILSYLTDTYHSWRCENPPSAHAKVSVVSAGAWIVICLWIQAL